MGPVERELRFRSDDWDGWVERWYFSPQAMEVVVGAMDSIGFGSEGHHGKAWSDVGSEAIEAAEALGL